MIATFLSIFHCFTAGSKRNTGYTGYAFSINKITEKYKNTKSLLPILRNLAVLHFLLTLKQLSNSLTFIQNKFSNDQMVQNVHHLLYSLKTQNNCVKQCMYQVTLKSL